MPQELRNIKGVKTDPLVKCYLHVCVCEFMCSESEIVYVCVYVYVFVSFVIFFGDDVLQ